MDEHDLRAVMDRAVAVAPPPMGEEPVLTAARRAAARRRAVVASTGSAAVVALVAVGVTVLVPTASDDGRVQVGNRPPASAESTAQGSPDDRAAALAAALDDLAPAGYGTPSDLQAVGDFAGRPLKTHEAMSAGTVDGTEMWNYAAGTPLTKDAGVGELLATVNAPGWESTGEGCALTPTAWDATTAECTEVTIDGRVVAVADVPAAHGLPPAQWAGYRHADGTVVFVMQSAGMPRSGRPALPALPMTGRQLAAVATDARVGLQR